MQSASTNPLPNVDATPVTQLRGRWLVIVRTAWFMSAAFAVFMLPASIPAAIAQLGTLTLLEKWRDTVAGVPITAPDALEFPFDLITLIVGIVSTAAYLTLAVVLFRRKGSETIALLFSVFLLLFGVLITGPVQTLTQARADWFRAGYICTAIVFQAFWFFFFLFPDGRFIPPWPRWLIAAFVLWIMGTIVFNDVVLPTSRPRLAQTALLFVWHLFLPLSGVAAQIYRYRRVSNAIERQQTKWVVLGFGAMFFVFFVLPLAFAFPMLTDSVANARVIVFGMRLFPLLYVAFLSLLPLSMGIAILRYRLFNIDVIINRTLVYGGLTALIVAVYVLVVGGFGVLLQTNNHLAGFLLATIFAAFLFHPLRARLQHGVDRVMSNAGERQMLLNHVEEKTHAATDRPFSIPHARTRFDAVSWAVVGVVLLVLALGGALFWLHVATPSDRARIKLEEWPWRHDGLIVTPIDDQPGGLRRGDVVVAVDRRSLEAWAQDLFRPGAPHPRWQLGQKVIYTVVRDGRTVDVPITLRHYPLGALLAQVWGTLLGLGVFLIIAAFIFVKRPSERAARTLLVCVTGIFSLNLWVSTLQISDLVGGTGFWLGKATSLGAFMTLWVAGIRFWIGFPRPRALLGRFRQLAPLLYLAPLAIYIILVLRPGAAGVLGLVGRLDQALLMLGMAYISLTLLAVIASYRTTRDAITRERIRWIARATIVFGGFGIVVGPLWVVVLGHPLIDRNLLAFFFLTIPIAFAVAILRYQLFDIDIIINRTLVYGALTAIVVGLYVLIVGALSVLAETQGSLVISLLATGLVAILFQPLRDRLQRGVNRLLYGERDDPYTVLARLGQRLEATLAPDAVLPTLVETIRDTLKLPYVGIALKEADETVVVAECRDTDQFSVSLSPDLLVSLSLVYQGETVGELRLAPRPGESGFSTLDRTLFADLARQAGIAAHAVRLHTQTVRLAADLQRSREQLVSTREEERRRIRRDLHDGLGPQLAGLTLQIDAAREELLADTAAADAMLVGLKADVQAAIADIRRLVYGLRPPALDELGLIAALRTQVAQYSRPELQVTLDAPDELPPLPAAVEVAVYRIVLEALTNVVRHAQARTCQIRLSVHERLELEICDDGRGLSEHSLPGVGLHAMRERAAELGGSCTIESLAGQGTCVRASLPVS